MAHHYNPIDRGDHERLSARQPPGPTPSPPQIPPEQRVEPLPEGPANTQGRLLGAKSRRNSWIQPGASPSLPTPKLVHPHHRPSSPYGHQEGNWYRAQKAQGVSNIGSHPDNCIQNNLFWGGFNYASWERNTERERNTRTRGETWVWTIASRRRKGTRNWNMMFARQLGRDREGRTVA